MVMMLLLSLLAAPVHATPATANGDIAGAVADSATGKPLPGGEVRITRSGAVVAVATTDAFGRYVVHNLPRSRCATSGIVPAAGR